MKFVYLGSQTPDCKVSLVFRKMIILGVWKDYIFLLILLSILVLKKNTVMKLLAFR